MYTTIVQPDNLITTDLLVALARDIVGKLNFISFWKARPFKQASLNPTARILPSLPVSSLCGEEIFAKSANRVFVYLCEAACVMFDFV